MKKVISKSIFLSLSMINISLSSCSIPVNTKNPILSTELSNNSPITNNNISRHVFKVSERKGATLSFSVNTQLNVNSFGLKATTNGKASKTANDVKSYTVYLIKNSASLGFPDNGDPLSNIVKTNTFNTNGETSSVVTFTNVPSSGSDYYYIAVRAFDGLNGSGTQLIKANDGHSTAWTGTTASNNRVSVSTGTGVNVSSTYQVSKTDRLMITPNLEDAVGSVVEGKITLTNGVASTVKSYKINLVTDSAQPETSKVLATDLTINRGSSDLTGSTHTVNLSNISSGTYYLTVKAYDSINGTGSKLGSSAVSTNKVTITNNQIVSFNPNTFNYFNITLDLTPVVSGEFKVNTYTDNNQFNPSVAMDSDGDFVVTWRSKAQDGGYDGIYAQRYDKNGLPQGNEFKVNTYTNSNKSNPSVAMDSDGDFIITWQSYGQDGNELGIYAQKYDSNGNTVGNEFQVNTYTDYSQSNPSVSVDSDGDFIVTWKSSAQDGSSDGVYARRYDNNGTAK